MKAVQRHLMAGSRWDLVISDDQSEGKGGGLTVIQTVRRYQGKSTPYIRISTDSLEQDEDTQVLLKPVKPAKLRSLIQFLLQREAAAHTVANNR
jgi:CheY-like chemotaxis protein